MLRSPISLHRAVARMLAAASLFVPFAPVLAQQFTVGADAACSTNSLQVAIDAASPGYTIRIARNQTYSAQAIRITNRDLHLIGGYETCSDEIPSGSTLLSGQGGAADSVITIREQVDVVLENLSLIRGDEVSDGYGGGLDVRGRGTVTLRNTALTQNYAGYGGGISAISDGGNLALVLEEGTVVQLNVAQFSGGGIRIEGDATLSAVQPQTWIANNEARGIDPSNMEPRFGNGGGIQVLAPARAVIGSPGFGNSGVVFGNLARYGGGIALDGRVDAGNLSSARLDLFTTDPARPTRIHGNRASQTGGGIHLLPDADGFFPFTKSSAKACLWDGRIDDNIAQQGAAIYADSNFATTNLVPSQVFFNPQSGDPSSALYGGCGARPAGAVSCAPGAACNTIEGNFAQNAAEQPSGAVILVQDEGTLVLRRASMRDSFGIELVRATSDAVVHLHDLLASGGSLAGNAIRVDSSERLVLTDSTIAGNFVGDPNVMVSGGPVDFLRNIVWQPGRRVVSAGAAVVVASSIVNDLTGFPSGPEALVIEPRFVDPLFGDFSLRAASPAVDFAAAVAGDDIDRDGRVRDRDLPLKANARGPRDIGALERQSLQPLVLNDEFDVDLRQWREVTAVASVHEPAQDHGGDPDSGSLAVNTTALVDQRAVVREQCIHLPGPGRYLLNGFGRTTGSLAATRDLLILSWAFRGNGGEACDVGAIDRTGNLGISSSTSWQSAAAPAEIIVGEGEWTNGSSIVVTLVVLDRSVAGTPTAIGWFDGITLTATGTQMLFADGFE